MRTTVALLSLITLGLGAVVRDASTFDPFAFQLNKVACPAVDRASGKNTTIQIGASRLLVSKL